MDDWLVAERSRKQQKSNSGKKLQEKQQTSETNQNVVRLPSGVLAKFKEISNVTGNILRKTKPPDEKKSRNKKNEQRENFQKLAHKRGLSAQKLKRIQHRNNKAKKNKHKRARKQAKPRT